MQIADQMIQCVMNGLDPDHVMEQATNGMINMLQRLPAKRQCPGCGYKVPKYPGAYPKRCPECGCDLTEPPEDE